MQKQWLQKTYLAVATSCLLLLACAPVSAESSNSTNYQVQNVQFGAGGSNNSCSSSYCAQSAIGDTTAGTANSKNYQVQFEPNPSGKPLMEVETIGGQQDLGYLDVSRTSTASDLVKVLNYSGSGYSVEITGNPPGQGAHDLDPLTAPSSAHVGAEQFGINLVANTDPVVGSNPVDTSSSDSTIGYPTPNYSTPNLFMYKNGDYVAGSSGSYGEADYTVSMIVDISNATPTGHYSGDFNTVIVPSY
jgi:hypothetical protein